MKYHSPNTDLAALQRELAGSRGSDPVDNEFEDHDDDSDVDDDPERDDGGSWATRGR